MVEEVSVAVRRLATTVRRMAMVIGVKPGQIAEYKRLHAEPWPEMNAALSAANIRNYSIYIREPENLLFGYWEYTGANFEADMQALSTLAISKRWLALTDQCQEPLQSRSASEWWCSMPEIFHLE